MVRKVDTAKHKIRFEPIGLEIEADEDEVIPRKRFVRTSLMHGMQAWAVPARGVPRRR